MAKKKINRPTKVVKEIKEIEVIDKKVVLPKKKKSFLPGILINKEMVRGPFKGRLTKSGVNISVGINNLRIGIGPRGTYLSIFGKRTSLKGNIIKNIIKAFTNKS